MLKRRSRISKPAIVGHIDKNVGALEGKTSNKTGEYGFIADKTTQPVVPTDKRNCETSSWFKISSLRRNLVNKEKKASVRNVFSERDKMCFVVLRYDQSCGRKEGHTVIRITLIGLNIRGFKIHETKEQISRRNLCQISHVLAEFGVVVKIKRSRSFRPNSDLHSFGFS